MNSKKSKKYIKELETFRGFNQEEWEKLNPGLKILIAHKDIISGRGSALFKNIIRVLTDHEKRLIELEKYKNYNLGYYEINETGGVDNIKIILNDPKLKENENREGRWLNEYKRNWFFREIKRLW